MLVNLTLFFYLIPALYLIISPSKGSNYSFYCLDNYSHSRILVDLKTGD